MRNPRRNSKAQKERRKHPGFVSDQVKRAARAKTLRRCEAIALQASGMAYKVFGALKLYADIDGYCWPLVSTLQKISAIRKRATIFAALKELETIGVIHRGRLISRSGRNSPTLYRIGGSVNKLPERAAARYVLLGPRRAKESPIPEHLEKGRGAAERHLANRPVKKVTPEQSPVLEHLEEGRGTAERVIACENPQKGTPGVPPNGTQNYSSEKADAVAVGSVEGIDSVVPSAAAVSLSHRHPPYEETAQPDDDEERERDRRLKATALDRFKKKNGDEFDPKLVEQWADQVEKRAHAKGITIMTARYFETGLENEAAMQRDVSKPPLNSDTPSPDDPSDDLERGISFWAGKLVESGAVSVENARAKVLEFTNEKGFFPSWEKCRGFYDLVRTNVFPDTPEPRENGENIYFPTTVREILELAAYPDDETTVHGVRTILDYLNRCDKFKSPEKRRAFEDRIAYQHQRKKSDEEHAQYRKKVNQRNRERYAEKKAARTLH